MLIQQELTPLIPISDDFARTIIQHRGLGAQAWLDRLPHILDIASRRWSLTLGEPYTALSYNFVTRATRANGMPVVLKVGFPEDKEFGMEAEALRLCDGHGMVRLLDASPDDATLLLERLEPGTLLATLEDDDQATVIAARVMRQLWRRPPEHHTFPTIARWALGLARHRARFGGPGPIPPALFDQAVALYRDLGASMAAPVLLHGDLHHFNILSATREPWLAIDPKGLVGEPAYETGALLRNPWPQVLSRPNLDRVLARRIALLAGELAIDRARIHGWALAQAVLSACWTLEDEDDAYRAEYPIAIAQALADL